jgi:hypothetical protein
MWAQIVQVFFRMRRPCIQAVETSKAVFFVKLRYLLDWQKNQAGAKKSNHHSFETVLK